MIDVVVPVYNQAKLVEQCIDALLAQLNVGRIVVVDDASTDKELLDYLEVIGVTTIHNKHNVGFVESVNRGMKLIKTEYGAIINSDTVPLSRDALLRIVATMEESKANVGGAKLLFMPGSRYGKPWTIQHAGVGFGADGVPYHPFMGLHRDTQAANTPRLINAVTGAVMGIRMARWRQLDGFDRRYAPGVYEDVDYCLRAGKVVYEPNSEWLHLMHGSGSDLFEYHDDNLALLKRRWNLTCDEGLYYGL